MTVDNSQCSYCTSSRSIFHAPLSYPLELEQVIKNSKTCSDCRLLMRAVEYFEGRLLLDTTHPKRAWHIHTYGSHTFALGYTDEAHQLQYTDVKRELPVFFYLDPGSRAFHDLRSIPPLCDDTSSSAAVHTAQRWVKECFEKHECCPRDHGPVRLPKRTLLLHSDGKVHLNENAPGTTGYYMCLSHCWGNYQPFRTTTESLVSLQDDIPLDSIPRTFKDGLQLAFKLGISHFWIDTLCIIQDDRDDWALQSYEMAEIYSNAYLTLAATASVDDRGGCFRSNTQLTWQAFEVPHEEGKKSADQPRLFARVSLHGHEHPLLDRGWVFQKQLLSPCVLYFNEHELAWMCRCYGKGKCECQQHELFRRGDMEGANVDEWVETVQRLTKRHLTYSSDKLPSLSGVAKHYHRRHGDATASTFELGDDTNLAKCAERSSFAGEVPCGNVGESATEQITWYNDSTRLGSDPPRSHRPVEYLSLSWSWASIDDEVSIGWYKVSPKDCIAQVLDAECTPSNHHNIYGEVKSGFLDLRAPLLQLSVRVGRETGSRHNLDWSIVSFSQDFGLGDRLSIENLAFDTLDAFEIASKQEGAMDVSCAIIGARECSGATSLILRAKDENACFERIGIAKLHLKPNPEMMQRRQRRREQLHARIEADRRGDTSREGNEVEDMEEFDGYKELRHLTCTTLRIV